MKTLAWLFVVACAVASVALWSRPSSVEFLWRAVGLAPAAHVPDSDTTPHYVVGSEVDGRQEYLYDIAVRVLGDGNRYREIFDLNRDRVQPDGGRLTDPTRLRAGWILSLIHI